MSQPGTTVRKKGKSLRLILPYFLFDINVMNTLAFFYHRFLNVLSLFLTLMSNIFLRGFLQCCSQAISLFDIDVKKRFHRLSLCVINALQVLFDINVKRMFARHYL